MQTTRIQGSGFTRLVSRQSGAVSILVSNTSLTVTVFLTDKDVGNPATTDSVTLGPNASKTFDGSSDVYGFVTGGFADVEVIEGGVATFLGLTESSGALVLPSIRSPNFNIANPPASPANSWALLSSGLAYVFGLILSGGTITGPDYIINPDGAFFYSGAPAFGNLAYSIVPGNASVNGPFGELALQGETRYINFGGNYLAWQSSGLIEILWASATLAGPWVTGTTIRNLGATIVSGNITVLTQAIGGTVTATDGTPANRSILSTDTWTAVTAFGANFAAGVPAPAYMLLPVGSGSKNMVKLSGRVNVTGATVAGATMFTLPYTLRQVARFAYPNTLAGYAAGGISFSMNAGGSVTAQAAGANGNVVDLDGAENTVA